MKLQINKTTKDTHYYLAETIRIGKKTKTVNIKKFGTYSELSKIHEDPEAHLRKVVKDLNESIDNSEFKASIDVNTNKTLNPNYKIGTSNLLNIGHFFLNEVYKKLNLPKFFKDLDKDSNHTFSTNEIIYALLINRILDPKSKLGAYNSLNNYFLNYNFDEHHVYRALDVLFNNLDELQTHLYKESNKTFKRDTRVLYYDCTNYHFEIFKEDELRKYGISKNGKRKPLVQMGLFMDKEGLPLYFGLTPGNVNEQTTAIPLEKNIIKDLSINNFIYVADGGLNSNKIRDFNSFGGRDYIVVQPLKSLPKKTLDLLMTDEDWQSIKTGKLYNINDIKDDSDDTFYKVLWINNPRDLGIESLNNKGRLSKNLDFSQRLIVKYDKKYEKLARERRLNKLEKADNLIKTNSVERKSNDDPRKYIKDMKENKIKYELDLDKIEHDQKFDGFYAYITNLEDEVKDLLPIVKNKWEIEDCFRTLKTDFKARPVYLTKESRITSHFAICFTALLIYKLLKKELLTKTNKHYTINEIITTLKTMNVTPLNDALFKATYGGSELLYDLINIYNLDVNYEYYFKKELNNLSR